MARSWTARVKEVLGTTSSVQADNSQLVTFYTAKDSLSRKEKITVRLKSPQYGLEVNAYKMGGVAANDMLKATFDGVDNFECGEASCSQLREATPGLFGVVHTFQDAAKLENRSSGDSLVEQDGLSSGCTADF